MRWLQYGCGAEPGVPRSPEQWAGFARFAVEMMAHFAGRGIVWEVWVSRGILLDLHVVRHYYPPEGRLIVSYV